MALPPKRGGRVLEVRALRAGPGLEARGLQTLAPDGSIRTAFYEEWAVPPAQGVEDALRRWLAESGQFAAVVAPGSRAVPDLTLEGELSALWSRPDAGQAHAALGITVLAPRGEASRIMLQRMFTQDAPLTAAGAQAEVQAQTAALAAVFTQIEAALRF
nr:ABC-type transport auxiliary lipoprotein family protein [Limobrevibacterium gyesilva]